MGGDKNARPSTTTHGYAYKAPIRAVVSKSIAQGLSVLCPAD